MKSKITYNEHPQEKIARCLLALGWCNQEELDSIKSNNGGGNCYGVDAVSMLYHQRGKEEKFNHLFSIIINYTDDVIAIINETDQLSNEEKINEVFSTKYKNTGLIRSVKYDKKIFASEVYRLLF